MRIIAAVGAALVLTCSIASATETPLKSLRTLVYEVSLGVRVLDVEHEAGFNVNGNTLGVNGNATLQHEAQADDRGSLRIDVVAATGDGGLVVDASFAGRNHVQPPIRVAIFPDGRLAYDPKHELSLEAAHVLPLLARGLLQGKDLSSGSSWDAGTSGNVVHYTVTHSDGDRATMQLTSDLHPSAVLRERDEGTTLYDLAKLCPITYDVIARIDRHRALGDDESQTQTLRATLISDTFAKR